MARKRKGRPVNGVLLINKQKGQSSNNVVQQVKRLFNAQKAGHTGALDPLATGMLPVGLGEATKFSQFLLDADKTYEVVAHLGVRTDTSDADGEIVATATTQGITRKQIDKGIETFRGEILQTPSIYSALKYQGKPLYYYARKGIDVPRPTRKITVFDIQVLSWQDDKLTMKISCSKGTYIRTIVDDLGELLGCGAHVAELRRTSVTPFQASKMLSVDDLTNMQSNKEEGNFSELDALLLPMDIQVGSLDKIELDAEAAEKFNHGMQLPLGPDFIQGAKLRVYNKVNQQFLGVAEVNAQQQLQPSRVVVYN
ncbi:tRNA pseudouridine(55) synthase TruB [Glaciecola sp. 1036]|uniref:tRNA pseudouridine(55) synthase TruB n=1 Tax=Alteromonadaceae TaxID=72275 RepID=UPI003D003C1F